MSTFNIPKQARNKYGFVKTTDANGDVVTVQQMMMTGSPGNGGGNSNNQPSVHSQVSTSQILADKGVGPEDTIVTDSYANTYFATATYLTTYYISKDELSTASYVTSNELSNAGYITNSTLSQASYVTTTSLQSTLSNASYVTQQGLSAMSYTTTTMVDEKLQDYSKTSVDKEEDDTRTVTQNDGIIVLASSGSRATTVTLPTTDIEDGKTIYIINKTGQAFTINTSGSIIDKDSSSTSRATQTISDNVIQVIYYDGEWFVI